MFFPDLTQQHLQGGVTKILSHAPDYTYILPHIKTHGSESRGQEKAAVCDERVSYLHVALL